MNVFRFNLIRVIWAVALLICAWYFIQIGREVRIFYGDTLGYYMYLPSTFIYHNHTSIETLPEHMGIDDFIRRYATQIGEGIRTPKGYALNQYTYGVALLEAPFFFLAHAFEKLRGTVANGFSDSYRWCLGLSTVFYCFMGLRLLYLTLKRHTSKLIANLVPVLLLVGTNMFWFTFHEPGMSHIPLFFLFALLMYLTELLYEKSSWLHFMAIGFTCGMITLIRPTDILCLLIPLLYNSGKPFIQSKIEFFQRHWLKILVAACLFLLPIIPQLLYWKWLAGSYVYYSYGPKQGFDFLHPKILPGLFGPNNGWLWYTPMMILSVLGLLFYRRLRPFTWSIYVFVPLYIWVIYSWYLPSYINGLGSRPMINIYALLAFPMAASVSWLQEQKVLVRSAGVFLLIFFAAANISFTLQQAWGIIWSEESKFSFNIRTLFRYHLTYDDLVVWDTGTPQPDSAKLKGGLVYHPDSSDTLFKDHFTTEPGSFEPLYLMQEGQEFHSLFVEKKFGATDGKGAKWLLLSGKFKILEPEYDIYKNHVLVVSICRGDEVILWEGIRINNKIGLKEDRNLEPKIFMMRDGFWGYVSFFIRLPEGMQDSDKIRLDIWNLDKKPLLISDLGMQFYR